MPRPPKILLERLKIVANECTRLTQLVREHGVPALKECGRQDAADVLSRQNTRAQEAIARYHAELIAASQTEVKKNAGR